MCGLRGGPPNTQPALVDARLVDEMLIIFDLARRLALAPVMHGRKKPRAKAAARRLLPGRFVYHNAALDISSERLNWIWHRRVGFPSSTAR